MNEIKIKEYRSKPTVIQAVLFDGSHWMHIANWTGQRFELVPEDRGDDPEIIAQVFDTLHSTWVGVKKGQYIIRGTKGEFYPCDPEVFNAKYDVVPTKEAGSE